MPIEHLPNPHNEEYMRVKAQKMGHVLHHQGTALDDQMIAQERAIDLARQEQETDA